jgi:acyl-CoA thioester hydrolase
MEKAAGFDHEYRVLITGRHLDTFGHLNNAAYLELFEAARWDWITQNGFGLREIRERGIGPVLLEVRLRFRREITNPEHVFIRSRTIDYRGKIGRVQQVMVRADGQTACTAEFVMALFDLKCRRLISPTPEWLRAVGVEWETWKARSRSSPAAIAASPRNGETTG